MSTSSGRGPVCGAGGRVRNERAQAAAERRTFFNHGEAPCTPAAARRHAREELAGEGDVGRRAARLDVVEDGRHAVTRRFAEPDVARDDVLVDAILEELANVFRDLLTEIRALVVHRQQHAGDVERRVERAAHAAERGDEIREAFEREVFAGERNEDGVGGDERVEREEAERRRRVDEDDVEGVAKRREHALQSALAIGERDELDLGAGELPVRGDERQVLDLGLDDAALLIGVVRGQRVVDRAPRLCP